MDNVMTKGNICLLNDDTPTYLHSAIGSFTLTMCSPSLFMDFTWRVEEDLHGSDHFPIVLEIHFNPQDDQPLNWQFHRADWNLFKDLCTEAFLHNNSEGQGIKLETLNDKRYENANVTIPKSTPNPK